MAASGPTHLAPLSPAASPPAAPVRTGDWVGGVLLSLLLPLVGFIAGIVHVAKGGEKRQVGILCMVLSTVVFRAWLALASSGAAEPPGSYSY